MQFAIVNHGSLHIICYLLFCILDNTITDWFNGKDCFRAILTNGPYRCTVVLGNKKGHQPWVVPFLKMIMGFLLWYVLKLIRSIIGQGFNGNFRFFY